MQGKNKANSYLAGLLGLVLIGGMGCDSGTEKVRSPRETYQQTSNFQQTNPVVSESRRFSSDELMNMSFNALNNNEYDKAVSLFRNYILQSYVEGEEHFGSNAVSNGYTLAVYRSSLPENLKDLNREMAEDVNGADDFYTFINRLRVSRNYALLEAFKLASFDMAFALSDRNTDTSQKKSRIRTVGRSIGESLTLHALKMIPLVDPNTGNITNIELYLRELMGDSFDGTPMGDDPLGVTFDLITSRYPVERFIAENILVQQRQNMLRSAPSTSMSGQIPQKDYYIGNTKIPPKYLELDRYGNVWNSIPETAVREMENERLSRERETESRQDLQRRAQESWMQGEQRIKQGADRAAQSASEIAREAAKRLEEIKRKLLEELKKKKD
jgi:hypothetical protein